MGWDVQKLFRLHAGEIIRALRRRGIDADVAAELTQDTFLRVLATPPGEATGINNQRAYLHAVSRNLGIDYLRRQTRSPLLPLIDEHAELVADDAPSAEARIHSRQVLLRTARALAALPPRTRRAFIMHRLEERTMAEIAAEFGVSVPRVWALIRDAYRHLVDQIGEDR